MLCEKCKEKLRQVKHFGKFNIDEVDSIYENCKKHNKEDYSESWEHIVDIFKLK